ncbi:MAG: CDP-alcohol phosphatidyltransferase family protein [Candidatus Planktophila sp.]|jgi:CDP-diacylglycerol--glycerol-3-phosphate 3-phosphatidyltransferase|nr:CDP-alcohol phosphatidyltransferase family protein [Candidatus Planktophila sp.]MBP7805450.1 CDP-alcohol phosphatidyltransferase family protein [Candidatus Planktophila sp.]
MISDVLKPAVTRIISPVARFFLRIGLTPNSVTAVGALCVMGSAVYFFPRGNFFVGTLVISFFMLSDLFDGAMARISSQGASKWGGFLDSTVDRVSDSSILFAVCIYLIDKDDQLSILYLVAIITGMLIPYIRAKAESMSIECSGGIAERTERAIIVLVGTGLHGLGVSYALTISAWLLAILGVITTCQRLLIVKRAI